VPWRSQREVRRPARARASVGRGYSASLGSRGGVETQEAPVQVELTAEAEELVRRKGGTVLVDYIRPTG
jgi:hypothetical protein